MLCWRLVGGQKMNKLDLLKAFDAVDDELLERSERAIISKRDSIQKRYIVVAVSILCLIIASFLIALHLN